MQFCAEQIKGESALDKGPLFDLGMVRMPGLSFSNAEIWQWSAAHRAVRLAEVAGLPPSVEITTVAAKNMLLAARRLWRHEPEFAARLVLRASNSDSCDTLNFVLSRARVAVIPDEAVQRLANTCIRGIEFIRRRIVVSDALARDYSRKRLVVLMEALSRFVLRMESQELDSIWSKVIGWYSHSDIAATMRVERAVWNLLLRTWEALPDSIREDRVLDLFEAPIVGMDGFAVQGVGDAGKRRLATNYPDTYAVLARHGSPPVARTKATNSRRAEIVRNLVRALKGDEETRKRAALRTLQLENVVKLSAGERSRISKALWGVGFVEHDELPSGTDLFDWAFLVLPEPKKGLAEKQFRAKWLDEDSLAEPKDYWETFWQVGFAIRNLRVRGKPFPLSEQEQSRLADAIKQWSEEPVPASLRRLTGASADFFPGGADDQIRKALSGLCHILVAIDIPQEVVQQLYTKAMKLNESAMPARSLYAGFARLLPHLLDDIVHEMKVALASDVSRIAVDASVGLAFWLRRASDENAVVVSPPIELVREIGVIVAARRKAALAISLRMADWIFAHGCDKQRDAIAPLVAEGLEKLHKKLQYGELQDEDFDVPLLRWRCAQLALSMIEKGYDANDAVIRWSREAANDPLPEVRHAGNNDPRMSKPD